MIRPNIFGLPGRGTRQNARIDFFRRPRTPPHPSPWPGDHRCRAGPEPVRPVQGSHVREGAGLHPQLHEHPRGPRAGRRPGQPGPQRQDHRGDHRVLPHGHVEAPRLPQAPAAGDVPGHPGAHPAVLDRRRPREDQDAGQARREG